VNRGVSRTEIYCNRTATGPIRPTRDGRTVAEDSVKPLQNFVFTDV
jgi:hypothetical protein